MAVKKYPQTFTTQLMAIFAIAQIVVASVVYAWQDYVIAYFAIKNPLLQTLLPFVVLETIAACFVIGFAHRPVKKINDAVNYTSRNTATKHTGDGGLNELIKTIRHLDAERAPIESVHTEHEFAQSLLDHLPVGIIALGPKREIIYANAAAPLHGGAKQINLDFKDRDSLDSWLDLVAEHDISASHWWRRLTQTASDAETPRRFYDCLAIYQQAGASSIETILIIIDRTDQYATEENELDFMALASHELRGPITVIRGYVDVLKTELKTSLSDDQRAFFERLDVSADRLSTYINNILNVSRFDRRHLQLNLKEEAVSTIYNTVRDDLELRASTQHRLLNVDFPKNLPTIAADRDSLCEVIINLVDNAIKYSSEGGLVIVTAKAKTDFVEISVQDNGIGIPSSLVGHVFEKFYRSHRSRENTVGTGLGLYIAKVVVESHGGTMSVRSTEGHGSVFSFTVPTYASVADKLLASNNSNATLIQPKASIKNHSLYRG